MYLYLKVYTTSCGRFQFDFVSKGKSHTKRLLNYVKNKAIRSQSKFAQDLKL